MEPDKFSIDPENNEFYLLYLGYSLNDINKMNYAKSIRMSRRMQMVIKMGSIHSYINLLGKVDMNESVQSKLKVDYPKGWIQKKLPKLNKQIVVEFDISDVIIQ
jgi:hypothetical protein